MMTRPGCSQDKLGARHAGRALLAWMRDRSARAADLTITTNDTQRELVRSRRAAGDRRAQRPARVVRRPPPLASVGRARLVFLGEIGIQDRVERAVEILQHTRDAAGIDAELLIIGDGPERGTVEERAASSGSADRVTITGWVTL